MITKNKSMTKSELKQKHVKRGKTRHKVTIEKEGVLYKVTVLLREGELKHGNLDLSTALIR